MPVQTSHIISRRLEVPAAFGGRLKNGSIIALAPGKTATILRFGQRGEEVPALSITTTDRWNQDGSYAVTRLDSGPQTHPSRLGLHPPAACLHTSTVEIAREPGADAVMRAV